VVAYEWGLGLADAFPSQLPAHYIKMGYLGNIEKPCDSGFDQFCLVLSFLGFIPLEPRKKNAGGKIFLRLKTRGAARNFGKKNEKNSQNVTNVTLQKCLFGKIRRRETASVRQGV